MSIKFCNVILIQTSRYIDKKFTYRTNEFVNLGQIVYVPFGKGNKILEAIVIEINEITEFNEDSDNNKEIYKIGKLTNLNEYKIEIALWIRDNYMCSYNEALTLFYPSQIRNGKGAYEETIILKDREKLQIMYDSLKSNAIVKQKLYKIILDTDIVEKKVLATSLKGKNINEYIKVLEELDIILLQTDRKYRELYDNFDKSYSKRHELNNLQKEIYSNICKEFSQNNKPILLNGITGCGKTEIYMELIEDMILNNKGTIVLVPEISLTPQTIARFTARFASKVAVLHSHLSQGQRYDQWSQIENLNTPVVIGARSALFAPVKNLGLIIIDECHEDAYKSEVNPKYDAVELSCKFNETQGVSLVLGSATPTIVQYYNAKQGKFKLFVMNKRANNKALPNVEIVDMKEDAKYGNISYLSLKLQNIIRETLQNNNQVILFLNRRGYSNFLSCDNCGYVPKCDNCDISLTYYKQKELLRCHYCNHEIKFESICQKCNVGIMKDIGVGTERVEKEVIELYPEATVLRMDKDTVTKNNSHNDILTEFKNTPGAILIGTQMIGKGLDFPNVTLVGVINADQGLNAPDYRSNERIFSLIEQVGGRAGRADIEGKVLIQTYNPDNYVLEYLKEHNYEDFYNQEIKLRQTFSYLPFSNILRILVSSTNQQNAANSSMQIKDALSFYLSKKNIEKFTIIGPYPCLINRIDNKYRWQILIKDTDVEIQLIKNIINYILTQKRNVVLYKNVSATVDINPINMV